MLQWRITFISSSTAFHLYTCLSGVRVVHVKLFFFTFLVLCCLFVFVYVSLSPTWFLYLRWCSCHLAVTRGVPRVEQELLTLPEHLTPYPIIRFDNSVIIYGLVFDKKNQYEYGKNKFVFVFVFCFLFDGFLLLLLLFLCLLIISNTVPQTSIFMHLKAKLKNYSGKYSKFSVGYMNNIYLK